MPCVRRNGRFRGDRHFSLIRVLRFIDLIATFPSANLFLQRLLWSRRIKEPYDQLSLPPSYGNGMLSPMPRHADNPEEVSALPVPLEIKSFCE